MAQGNRQQHQRGEASPEEDQGDTQAEIAYSKRPKRVMTAPHTIIMDEKRGEYRHFWAGDEFDIEDDAHLLAQMGDHLFAEVAPEAPEEVPLEEMKQSDLVALAKSLKAQPLSNKKGDLIAAIRAMDGPVNE
jgi:hypothetical protein